MSGSDSFNAMILKALQDAGIELELPFEVTRYGDDLILMKPLSRSEKGALEIREYVVVSGELAAMIMPYITILEEGTADGWTPHCTIPIYDACPECGSLHVRTSINANVAVEQEADGSISKTEVVEKQFTIGVTCFECDYSQRSGGE